MSKRRSRSSKLNWHSRSALGSTRKQASLMASLAANQYPLARIIWSRSVTRNRNRRFRALLLSESWPRCKLTSRRRWKRRGYEMGLKPRSDTRSQLQMMRPLCRAFWPSLPPNSLSTSRRRSRKRSRKESIYFTVSRKPWLSRRQPMEAICPSQEKLKLLTQKRTVLSGLKLLEKLRLNGQALRQAWGPNKRKINLKILWRDKRPDKLVIG